MDGARVMHGVRVMEKARTAVEGARLMPEGVRDQELVLDNADALGLLAMRCLAHAWRSVVLHLDGRDVVEASLVAASCLDEVRRGPQPAWAAEEVVDECMLCLCC